VGGKDRIKNRERRDCPTPSLALLSVGGVVEAPNKSLYSPDEK
jgi:hypothetical protein